MNSLSAKFAKNPLPLSGRLMELCMRYRWPGNLRELGNLVKRYLVLEDEKLVIDELQAKCQCQDISPSEKSVMLPASARGLKELVRGLKDEAEAREILRILESTNWDRKQAAAELNISYKALSYKIKQYGVSPHGRKNGAGSQQTS
jgi:DNA-binding NtrC family response regulator